jgi:hypothetical protein
MARRRRRTDRQKIVAPGTEPRTGDTTDTVTRIEVEVALGLGLSLGARGKPRRKPDRT